MKYVIASDIHGNTTNLLQLLDCVKNEQPDKLILLGDLYYHGPRNPLTNGYDPMRTSDVLNAIKDSLIVVRGNCDAEVDEMISQFKFNPNYTLTIGTQTTTQATTKKVFLTHGHNMDEGEILNNYDILIYGHTHVGKIEHRSQGIVANCGSVGLPKNNSPKSYILLNDTSITLKDFSQNILDSITF